MARSARQLTFSFVPEAYYSAFMEARSLSLTEYPYSFTELDPVVKRHVPFCIFDIDVHYINGQPTRGVILVYKSVFSKTRFRRIIYQ